eukprot:363658-Chlamydomonas_euryale.AAC.4
MSRPMTCRCDAARRVGARTERLPNSSHLQPFPALRSPPPLSPLPSPLSIHPPIPKFSHELLTTAAPNLEDLHGAVGISKTGTVSWKATHAAPDVHTCVNPYLWHHCDGTTERRLRHRAHVHTIHAHRAAVHVVKPEQQSRECGLACVGRKVGGQRRSHILRLLVTW